MSVYVCEAYFLCYVYFSSFPCYFSAMPQGLKSLEEETDHQGYSLNTVKREYIKLTLV